MDSNEISSHHIRPCLLILEGKEVQIDNAIRHHSYGATVTAPNPDFSASDALMMFMSKGKPILFLLRDIRPDSTWDNIFCGRFEMGRLEN